jgi:hypothetical protein
LAGDIWTTQEIESVFGVSFREWFPANADGQPLVVAVKPDLNPRAPKEIYCSSVVENDAEKLVDLQHLVPVFLYRDSGSWEYCGQFRPDYISRNPPEVMRAIDDTERGDDHDQGPIVAILVLESADQ